MPSFGVWARRPLVNAARLFQHRLSRTLDFLPPVPSVNEVTARGGAVSQAHIKPADNNA